MEEEEMGGVRGDKVAGEGQTGGEARGIFRK